VIQKRSYKLLDNVAAVIKSHPDLKIKIDGHTDDVGSDKFNLKLSTNRAASAVAYLVKRGVDASRLSSEGFGEQYPIAENKKAKGRAANRRVEFNIVGTIETLVPAETVPATTK
jgi:outer membrane protein OmpA-like peptidoglycan-associated protein